LLIGPIGLLQAKRVRDKVMQDEVQFGADAAFILMLFLTSLTGLLLLLFRATPAMGVLLAVHLGVVFALFVTMPYSKFVHGLYRFGVLVRYAKEHRQHG
jgi:citrate/tricarballylate utilization protein